MQQVHEYTAPPQRTYHFKSTQLNRLSGANDGWRNMVDHITSKQNAGHAPDRNFCHTCLAMICAGITPDKSLQEKMLNKLVLQDIQLSLRVINIKWDSFFQRMLESVSPKVFGGIGPLCLGALSDYLCCILPDDSALRRRIREDFSVRMVDERTPRPQGKLFNT